MICMTLSFVRAVLISYSCLLEGELQENWTTHAVPLTVSFVLQRPFLQRPRVLESLKQTVVEYDWQGSLL